jgi:hypothetical protein
MVDLGSEYYLGRITDVSRHAVMQSWKYAIPLVLRTESPLKM